MTSGRIAIAVAVLLHLFLFGFPADAQITQQTLMQPTPQTRQQLTKALQELREKKDLHGEAVTLLQLGMVEAGLGNVDGARSNLAGAVRKMRAQNDLLGVWVALLCTSQLEVAVGRPADALPHLEKAFTVIDEAKASTAPLNLATMAAFASISGFSPQILQSVDASNAGLMKLVLLQYVLEPMTHDAYGSVLTQVGRFEKAEAELKAAAAGSIYTQGMYDFSIESHFGDLRLRQQRYDEARAHYMKALNASSKPALKTAAQQIKTDLYGRLARLETIAGNPEEAKRWSEKARDLGKNGTGKR